MEGTIKWFNNSKGYGFIGLENGPDVFVHYSGIVGDGYRTLREGDRVRFELCLGLVCESHSSPVQRWSRTQDTT